jgi:hypothetical protein
MVSARARWAVVAAAAAGGVGELVRRRRSAQSASPPPMTTQSSPGQIADLQQAHGAEMTPASAPAPGEDTADG